MTDTADPPDKKPVRVAAAEIPFGISLEGIRAMKRQLTENTAPRDPSKYIVYPPVEEWDERMIADLKKDEPKP